MRVKITQGGWAGFTGHLGAVLFENGVSVEDISKGDAAFLAGILQVEELGTGKNPSDTQRILDQYNNSVPAASVAVEGVQFVSEVVHTKESLEKIADASGIKGLREISDPLGIKGLSIAELIEKILAYKP